MSNVVVVVFDDEQKTGEGIRAIRDLHRNGSLTRHADAVIVKNASGEVSVRVVPDSGPGGALSGFLLGSLAGLLGGPVALAVGAGSGSLIGAVADLIRSVIGNAFLGQVSDSLLPGRAAVVVEIDERSPAALDACMESLGGRVIRRTPIEIEHAFFAEEIEHRRPERLERTAPVRGQEPLAAHDDSRSKGVQP